MDTFRKNRLSASHFASGSGYGYDDIGRDLCDRLFADCMDAEAGFARHSVTSGTHAIAIGLYALLRPGETLYSVTGRPYDTLEGVIGIGGAGQGQGSLADYGVAYRETPLTAGSEIDLDEVRRVLAADRTVKVVFVQRSKGYQDRRTLSAHEIDALYELVKSMSEAYVVIDNNYGEFCEVREPKGDLLCGSLIKNAGGGIAECGGYLVGSAKAVELAAYRMTVPGIGLEAGSSVGQNKNLIKGLFYAPHTVAQALKTAVFAAKLFETLGFDVSPKADEPRYDVIQMLCLKDRERLVRFCRRSSVTRRSTRSHFPSPTRCRATPTR